MSAPTLSVILPVFNAEQYVDEAIRSILSQDYGNFELIIANDGSTDNSLNRIRSHTDRRIRVIENKSNCGLISTLNMMISECRSEFIARMDADDISQPTRFTDQLARFAQNKSLGVVSCFMTNLNERNVMISHHFLEPDEVKAALLFTNPIVHPGVMFRKSSLGQHLHYDTQFLHAEDYGLWLKLVPHTEFAVIPSGLISHRTHTQQVSVQHYQQQLSSIKKAHAVAFGFLGIEATAAESEIQFQLFTEQYPESGTSFMFDVENWLLKLSDSNRTKKVFPAPTFEATCGEWWFRVNQYYTQKGQSNHSRYQKSQLAKYFDPTVASRAKMIYHSLANFKKQKS